MIGTKRDRPAEAPAGRSRFQDLHHRNDSKIIIAHLYENASPNFAGEGVTFP